MRIKNVLINALLVIFSVFCIELILRVAGAANNYFSISKNSPVQITNKEKVVLCIGESTTAKGLNYSYPSQLQALLDIKYGKNFYRVINAGVIGTDTSQIYKRLDHLVSEYKPDYVITMMGINDVWSITHEISFLDNFKIYTFIKILKDHIRAYSIEKKTEEHRKNFDIISTTNSTDSKFETTQLPFDVYSQLIQNAKQVYDDKNFKKINHEFLKIQKTEYLRIEDFYKLVMLFFEIGNKDQAQKLLWELANTKNDFKLFREIGKTYFIKYDKADAHGREVARKFFTAALKINPNDDESLRYLSRSYSREENYYELALELAKRSFDNGSRHSDLIRTVDNIYKKTNRDQLAIPFLTASIYTDDKSDIWLWIRLIEIYIESGDRENAEKYLKLAYEKYPGNAKFNEVEIKYRKKYSLSTDQLKSYTVKNFYEYPPTKQNYIKIVNYLTEKNINLIVMQYPFRPIKPIQDLLFDYPTIQYVENYEVFVLASKKFSYDELFINDFAGDFGHFKPIAAKIIAQNIVDQVNFSSKE